MINHLTKKKTVIKKLVSDFMDTMYLMDKNLTLKL